MRKKFTTMFEESIIERLKIQAILEKTDVSKILEKLAIDYLAKNEGRDSSPT
ncbi:hypothetical protein [Desulfosporosinus lacus]|uniref:Uncharacterized protein n=1 Tax=Desulfosporosinus lacus DSM 15449 TaxID=1121420 RepID=A0A1M5ZPT5_9FIRM|nr:hypothetical protein [Desulfosporosinus lacus]SHI26385.1 hypothetical protein SAMN02746098_03510 [Desulfosporosinus lacus DSM 15449]